MPNAILSNRGVALREIKSKLSNPANVQNLKAITPGKRSIDRVRFDKAVTLNPTFKGLSAIATDK